MNDPFSGLLLGTLVFCAMQLCSIKYRLDDIKEWLYSKGLPTDEDDDD